MSDDELLKLLEEVPPEEWSAEQIEALAARWADAPELRSALHEHLWLDQTLHQALGRVSFSAAELFARAEAESRRGVSRRLAWLVAVAALVVVCAGVWLWQGRESATERVVEQLDPSPLPQGGTQPVQPTASEKPAPPVPEQPSTPPKLVGQPLPPGGATQPAPSNEPWSAALAAAPLSVEQAAWLFPALDAESAEPKILAQWFQTVRGKLEPYKEGRLVGLGLEGVARLRAPLGAGFSWRVAFRSRHQVRFHFWNDVSGATLEFAERNGGMWTAFQAGRDHAAQPTPQRLAWVTAEGDRYRRIGNGIVDFRYQQGQIVLRCGDEVIVSAPLAEPPQQIVIEADKRVTFGALELIRSAEPPLPTETEFPLLAETVPRELPLVRTLTENAKLVAHDDGALTLSASDLKQPAWIAWPVANAGWSLLEIELESATPGSGMFVSDRAMRDVQSVGVYLERQVKQPFIAYGSQSEKSTESTHDLGRAPFPVIGQRQWYRWIVRPRGTRLAAGLDGRHWGDVLPWRSTSAPTIDQVGLFIGTGKGPRAITLRRFRQRSFVELPQLVPPEWRAQLPNLTLAPALHEWEQLALAAQPARVDARAWRWACAAQSLVQGVQPPVIHPLMELLLEAVRAPEREAASAQRLLDEVALLLDTADYRTQVLLQTTQEELALRAWRQGERAPLELWRATLTRLPMPQATHYDPLATQLTRLELLEQVQHGGWNAIHRLTRWAGFYAREFPEPRRSANREAAQRLLTWAEALAQRNRPAAEQTGSNPSIPASWRHPLVEQLGKEGYNVLAELESALSGGALKDACQIISSMTADQAVGLLPNARDPELLVSLPNAVALAMREHPDLARTMQSEFGQLAELRLRQAAVDADARVMQALTTQFHSTSAAAEAQIWLGDRALSRGDLRRAEAAYHAAKLGTPLVDEPHLMARQRLLAAMNGRLEGVPPTGDVHLGDVDLSAVAFERLVQESLKNASRNAMDTLSEPVASLPPESLPQRRVYEVQRTATLDGAAGRDPASLQRREIDQLGAQTGVAVAPPLLIVNSRFAVAAYSLADGARVWQRPCDADHGRTHAWPMITMRPLVAGPLTLVRRLTNWGPELVALDTATGEVRWRSVKNENVASDPVVLTGRVAAITLQQVQQDVLQLHWTSYDPRTGKVVSQQPIIQLRDVWSRELPLTAQVVGDTVLVVGGGCVIGCDLEGNPRWLRRQTWLWGVNDLRLQGARFDPPLIDGSRAIVVQPGVPNVTCVDVHTGQQLWQRVLPDNSKGTRLLGLGGSHALLQVGDQLIALGRESGEWRWHNTLPGCVEGCLIDTAGNGLVALAERSGTKSLGLRLVWLDGATGQVRDTSYVRSWSQELPWFGPWVMHGERLFAITGGEPVAAPVTRQLVELRPIDMLPTDGVPLELPNLAWSTTRVTPHLPASFMGWTVLQSGGGDDRPTTFRAESDGRRNQFHGYAINSRPLHFVRRLEDPTQEHRVGLKFETPLGTPAWSLQVYADQELVHAYPAEKQSPPAQYETEVKLPRGTRHAFVVLRHLGSGGGVSLWERLELHND